MRPSIGRIVHFQIREGVYRAAMVTEVFESDCYSSGFGCNLTVFLDEGNDTRYPELRGALKNVGLDVVGAHGYAKSCEEGTAVGTWRWPPRV